MIGCPSVRRQSVLQHELKRICARTSAPWRRPRRWCSRWIERPAGRAALRSWSFRIAAHAEQAIQKFNGQVFNGRPLAVSEARAREDRGPGGPPRPGGFSGPRPGGGFAPRPPGSFGGPPRPFDPNAPGPPRARNFGPDAKPQRGPGSKAKKKEASARADRFR